MNSYIPTKVTEVHDLNSRLNKIKYNEIIENLEYHFQNCYITNFDKIHHECRGDKLTFSKKYYETIFYDQLKQNISEDDQERFISFAIRSKRDDMNFERKVIIEHFNKLKVEKELERKAVFLSAMKKKFFKKSKYVKVNYLFYWSLTDCHLKLFL